MGDSQRPKPNALQFDVPDLDLEPIARSRSKAAAAATSPQRSASSNVSDLDPFELEGSSSFGSGEDFELEAVGQLDFGLADAPPSGVTALRERTSSGEAEWPTGRAPDLTQLELDPLEIELLADYGDAPTVIHATPAYALRIFTRQRELKRELRALALQSERAELERETVLADLAQAVRPAAEEVAQFRRLFAPLVEIEQVASQRGQALVSINAQLDAHTTQLDTDRARIDCQLETEQRLEQEATRLHDEREAAAKRAEAKLKRVHIETRAVTHVAEQKLGPKGGEIPAAEAEQLETLSQRATQLQPELTRARSELAQAQQALEQVQARIVALRASERQTKRKKQALGEQAQKEVRVRSQGLSESQARTRALLADLGRAVLGSAGLVEIPPLWLERVRAACGRADKLILKHEMHRRALSAYDQTRAQQGVRLACTAAALIFVLWLLKLIF